MVTIFEQECRRAIRRGLLTGWRRRFAVWLRTRRPGPCASFMPERQRSITSLDSVTCVCRANLIDHRPWSAIRAEGEPDPPEAA